MRLRFPGDSGLEDDIACYYAVVSRGEVGVSRFELEATVTPLSDAHWRRADVGGHGESAANRAKPDSDIDTL